MKKLLTILFVLFEFSIYSQIASVNPAGTITRFGGTVYLDSIHYNYPLAKINAYLTASDTTIVINVGQYYFLQGTFTNEHTVSFGFVGDTVQYQNGNYRLLKGGYNTGVSTNKTNCTVTIAIYINNTPILSSIQSAYCKTAGEVYMVNNNNWLVKLMHDDKIKIMVTSDIPNTEIITYSVSTSLFELP